MHRPGESRSARHSKQLRDVQLGVGDVLLVQGPAEQIAALKQRNELLVLDATSDVPLTAKAPLALADHGGHRRGRFASALRRSRSPRSAACC